MTSLRYTANRRVLIKPAVVLASPGKRPSGSSWTKWPVVAPYHRFGPGRQPSRRPDPHVTGSPLLAWTVRRLAGLYGPAWRRRSRAPRRLGHPGQLAGSCCGAFGRQPPCDSSQVCGATSSHLPCDHGSIPRMRNATIPRGPISCSHLGPPSAHPYMAAYAASKGGVQAMTNTGALALEFRQGSNPIHSGFHGRAHFVRK